MDTRKNCISTMVFLWLLVSGVCSTAANGAAEPSSLSLKKLPYTFHSSGPRRPTGPIVFEGPFPKLPKMMMVYMVKDPNVTEATVQELARKRFGMPEDAELTRSKGMRLYRLRSSTHLFVVSPVNGSFNISKIRKDRPKKWVKEDYPSREECKTIAREYLKARKLLPADAYWRGIADNISGAGVMSVGFGRRIGSYGTWGAGARILVEIGPGGEVVDVRKAWQELIPYKPYPVISPKEALEELQSAKGVLMHGSEGKVNEITFRYYTPPQKQEYVQPIYYFDCKGPEGSFYGIVPAIKAEYLKPREDSTPKPITWIKCRNPQCKAEYQITLKEYSEYAESYLKEHPNSPTAPSLFCRKCGKESAYRAVKCEKCGLIFEAGWKGPDYYDRCPKCGCSKAEEKRKKTR